MEAEFDKVASSDDIFTLPVPPSDPPLSGIARELYEARHRLAAAAAFAISLERDIRVAREESGALHTLLTLGGASHMQKDIISAHWPAFFEALMNTKDIHIVNAQFQGLPKNNELAAYAMLGFSDESCERMIADVDWNTIAVDGRPYAYAAIGRDADTDAVRITAVYVFVDPLVPGRKDRVNKITCEASWCAGRLLEWSARNPQWTRGPGVDRMDERTRCAIRGLVQALPIAYDGAPDGVPV